ncbi:triosephosphate isomerase [Moniliophthora roreri]|nr:triosephosphate isomerase [Moniliophthora roreri]
MAINLAGLGEMSRGSRLASWPDDILNAGMMISGRLENWIKFDDVDDSNLITSAESLQKAMQKRLDRCQIRRCANHTNKVAQKLRDWQLLRSNNLDVVFIYDNPAVSTLACLLAVIIEELQDKTKGMRPYPRRGKLDVLKRFGDMVSLTFIRRRLKSSHLICGIDLDHPAVFQSSKALLDIGNQF